MSNWELYKGNTKLANIKEVGIDQPWFIGEFFPCPGFDKYRPIFERAEKFIKNDEFDSEESEKTFKEIDELQLSIKRIKDQKLFAEVMITLENNEIWWRI